MTFTAADASSYVNIANQAIVDGIKGNGVLNGLAVSERGSGANMSVDIATGNAIADSTKIIKASVTNVVVTASDPTNDRIDIVVLNGGGTLAVTAGTASVVPVPPSSGTDEIYLASIFVGAGVTSILNANITDLRMDILDNAIANATGSTTSTSEVELATTVAIDDSVAGDIYKINIITDKLTATNQAVKLRVNDGTTDLTFTLRSSSSATKLIYNLYLRQGTLTNTDANLDGWENEQVAPSHNIVQQTGTLQASWIANSHTISLRGNLDIAGTLGFIFNVERLGR